MAGGRSSAGKRQSAWEDRALDRVRQQALQRGHRIAQAARQIVAEGGLDALTLRAVLDKAGLAPSGAGAMIYTIAAGLAARGTHD
ncbi:MAG: hypothetical protein FJ148_07720 [Deltaproteobacteria bacterium]|nr:hypothetical protein [Deltaproteobacteria bacterium]